MSVINQTTSSSCELVQENDSWHCVGLNNFMSTSIPLGGSGTEELSLGRQKIGWPFLKVSWLIQWTELEICTL